VKSRALLGAAIASLLFMILNTKKTPLGIRNDNPLNIRTGTNWNGAIGENGGFVVFDSPLMGLRAGARVLRTYRDNYGIDNIHDIINRFAPPIENDTQSYVDHVADVVGVGEFEPLTPEQYPLLIAAMIKHENGQQPYDIALISEGFALGFLA
jgi:hypothetical protein